MGGGAAGKRILKSRKNTNILKLLFNGRRRA